MIVSIFNFGDNMCGIFGFSFAEGKLSAAHRAVLATHLAIQNDTRGGDSYGVVGIDAKGAHVSRGLGDLTESSYECCNYNTLFAHTRYASVGDIKIKNAHPFKIGNILGAHNGAVYNHEELSVKYNQSYEVDSQYIFHHLNNQLPFEELVARGAIEWINTADPQTIYLSKLFAGELAIYGIGTEDDVEGIVWSSSYKHLLRALFCSGISDHFRFEVRRGRVYSVNNGQFNLVRDIKLNVTEPVFKKENEVLIHYSPNKSGLSLCGDNGENWTIAKSIVTCVECMKVSNNINSDSNKNFLQDTTISATNKDIPQPYIIDRNNESAIMWHNLYSAKSIA